MKAKYKIHKWQKQHLQSNKRFHLLVWHRKARKTYTALLKTFKEAINNRGVYWIIEPTFRLAKQTIWEDLRMLNEIFPEEVVKKRNQTDLSLQLVNGSWIYLYGADKPDYLRGPNPRGVVIDEYAVQQEDVWTKIVAPIIFSNGGWTMFCFTPKGKNHAWKLWRETEGNEKWERTYLPVSLSKLIQPDEIENIKKTLPQDAFRQEFECEFLEGEGTVFRKIRQAIKHEPVDYSAPHVFGVDLARKMDFTVVVGINLWTNHVDVFDRWNTVDWTLTRDRIASLVKKFPPSPVIMEVNSIGDPFFDFISKTGISIIPITTTGENKNNLINRLSIFIENKYITYEDDPTILGELEAFGYDITPLGRIQYSAPSGLHDDIVMALAFAVSHISEKPRPRTLPVSYQFDWQPKPQQINLDPYD